MISTTNTMLKKMLLAWMLLGAALVVKASDDDSGGDCATMAEVFTDGTQLCEVMWDGAFTVVDDDEGYTMWFTDETNPNDAMSVALGFDAAPDVCHLYGDYYHKANVSAEPDTFTECRPWRDESCCTLGTTRTAAGMRDLYGPGYRWDRCGALSPACERFFVEEACFYECEPNVGLWRKYPTHEDHTLHNTTHDDAVDIYNHSCNVDWGEEVPPYCQNAHNTWQLHAMPIKRSYCNAWYDACRFDPWCAHDSGSYFSPMCQAVGMANWGPSPPPPPPAEEEDDDDDKKGPPPGATAMIALAVVAVVAFLALSFVLILVFYERRGQPLLAVEKPANAAEQSKEVQMDRA